MGSESALLGFQQVKVTAMMMMIGKLVVARVIRLSRSKINP